MDEDSKASLVLGILSIVVDGISFIICWWLSIIGLILGVIGLMTPGRKVCPVIGVCLSVVSFIVTFVVFRATGVW